VGTTAWTASIVVQHSATQSWIEVPAKIEKASLEETRGRKGRSKYKARATYTYEYEGRAFTSERVALNESSDNFGDFQRRTASLLERHRQSGKPLPCFVNPEDPSQAILFPQIRWEMISFFSAFAAVFGCVGLGMLTAALVNAPRTSEHVSGDISPDEPWRMRADWAAGSISSGAASAAVVPVLAVVALWWWIGSAPLILKLPAIWSSTNSGWKWLTLLFPVAGCIMIVLFAYQLIRRRKYGESVLQLASIPGVVGGQLAGVVRIPQTIHADGGCRLKLSCTEFKSDRNNKDQDILLWQDERLIAEPLRDIAAGTTSIPVLFAIPFEAKDSSRPTSKRDIRWTLDVDAKTSGVNYRSRFDVPVFKTPESSADFKLDQGLATDFITAPSPDLVLRDAGIVKEALPGGGVRLIIPAARNIASAIVSTLITVFIWGAVLFMRSIGIPMIFPLVFAFIGVPLFFITLDLWLYRSVVEARSDGLTFRGGLFGIGRKHSWISSDIKDFTFEHSMSSGRNVWKNVEIVFDDKKKKVIAKSICSKPAQEAVINELNAALGRGAA
jgi:hypothetical protein